MGVGVVISGSVGFGVDIVYVVLFTSGCVVVGT